MMLVGCWKVSLWIQAHTVLRSGIREGGSIYEAASEDPIPVLNPAQDSNVSSPKQMEKWRANIFSLIPKANKKIFIKLR